MALNTTRLARIGPLLFALAMWPACGPAHGSAGGGQSARTVGAQTGQARPCRGPLSVVNDEQLAYVLGCRRWSGDLTVRGGAVTGRHESAPRLAHIDGTLTIGPTLALGDLGGLSRIEEITGSLLIKSNLSMTGVFLNRLRQIGGDLTINDNVALAGISVPALTRIGGALRILRNSSLAHVQLDALTDVVGPVQIARNRALELLRAPALRTPCQRADITVNITDSPGLRAQAVTRCR